MKRILRVIPKSLCINIYLLCNKSEEKFDYYVFILPFSSTHT